MAPSGTLVSGASQMNSRPFEATANPALGQLGVFCGELPAVPFAVAGELVPDGVHLIDPRTFALDGTSTIYSGTLTVEAGDALEFIYQYGRVEGESVSIGQLSRDAVRGTPPLPGFFGAFAGRLLLDQRGGGGITADSHEMRVNWTASDRLSGKVGGFYSSTSDFDVGGSLAAFPNRPDDFIRTNFPAGELFPPGLGASLREDKSFAIFGAVNAAFTDTLRLSAEGRYTFEDRREQARTFPAFSPAGPQLLRSFEYFTPRVALDWRVTPDQLVYASVARGVKSGGFNGRALSPTVLSYDPETNWTYEIGAKTQWLDRRLTVNIAAYHVDWQQLQFNTQDPGGTIGTALVLRNLEGAKVWGFEAEANAQVTRELNLSIGGAWNDTTFVDGTFDLEIPRGLCTAVTNANRTCPYTGDISGNRLPRSPQAQLFGAATYSRELSENLRTTARVSASWQGKSFIDNSNDTWMPARTIVDASLALEHKNVTVRVWTRNLFDNKFAAFGTTGYATSGAGSGTSYGVIAGERRTIGVTASVNY